MDKFINKNKYFCLSVATIAILGAQIAHADDDKFQNNLLKMDVYKSSQGGIKVTLYTTKPYSEPVIVNKKSEKEYVILMPETVSSLTSKPNSKSAPDVLSNIEVKTQQYGSTQGQKGYTKIIISTLKPVEITPQVQTLNVSNYKISEEEKKELLTSVGKKTRQPVKQKSTQTVISVKKTPAKPRVSPQVESQTKSSMPKKAGPLKAQKPVQKTATLVEKPIATPKIIKSEKLKKTEEVQTSQKEIKKTIEAQQAETNKEIQTPVESPKQTETALPVTQQAILPPVQPVETAPKYVKYINFIMANKNLAAAASIPIILLLIMLLRISKKRKQQLPPRNLATNFEQPQKPATDYSKNIDEGMNWKEKFKTYQATAQKGALSEEQKQPSMEDFKEELKTENLFDEEIPLPEGFSVEVLPDEEEEEEALDLENLFDKDSSIAETVNESYEEPTVETFGYAQNQEQEETSWDEFEDLAQSSEPSEQASIDELFNEEEEETDSSLGDYTLLQQEEANQQAVFTFDRYLEQPPVAPQLSTEETRVFADFESTGLTPQPQVLEEERDESGLLKKSEYKIDETKGFYLVDFEKTTALIGYIGEEIFVLKKFKEPIEKKLQARMSEHLGDSANYMTKVGNFKALVKVTPQKMNLLIEL